MRTASPSDTRSRSRDIQTKQAAIKTPRSADHRLHLQVIFCVQDVVTDPCPVPLSLVVTTPSSRMPALNQFWIRRIMRGSPIRSFRKRTSQSWLTASKNAAISAIQNVVHLGAGDADHQRVQRIVLAAPGRNPCENPRKSSS